MITDTRANIISLRDTNNLVAGELYKVQDAKGSPILTALNSSLLSHAGHGTFFIPPYGSIPFWSSGGSFAINDECIWNGLKWKNLTGTNTAAQPQNDATNWGLVTASVANGYTQVANEISYDIDADVIFARKDSKNNSFSLTIDYAASYITNPIDEFQWESPGATNNTVIEGRLPCINQNPNPTQGVFALYGNYVANEAVLDAASNQGAIVNCRLINEAKLNASNNRGIMANNWLEGPSCDCDWANNEGKFDDHKLFTGYITAPNQAATGEIRGVTLFNGSYAVLPDNEGKVGAIDAKIGSSLTANSNKGIIEWVSLTQSTSVEFLTHECTVGRIECRGNHVLTFDLPSTGTFLKYEASLNGNQTIDGSAELWKTV